MSEYTVQEDSHNGGGPTAETSTLPGCEPAPALGQGTQEVGNREGRVSAAASPRQCAANQANALRSTGPRTQAGKARVSRNAVQHGLRGHFQLIAGEDLSEYAADSVKRCDRQAPSLRGSH